MLPKKKSKKQQQTIMCWVRLEAHPVQHSWQLPKAQPYSPWTKMKQKHNSYCFNIILTPSSFYLLFLSQVQLLWFGIVLRLSGTELPSSPAVPVGLCFALTAKAVLINTLPFGHYWTVLAQLQGLLLSPPTDTKVRANTKLRGKSAGTADSNYPEISHITSFHTQQ